MHDQCCKRICTAEISRFRRRDFRKEFGTWLSGYGCCCHSTRRHSADIHRRGVEEEVEAGYSHVIAKGALLWYARGHTELMYYMRVKENL
jgi:hypothetical protein